MSFSESPVRRPACAAMLPLLSWDVGLLKDTDCTAQPNHVMLASSTSFSLQRTLAMQILCLRCAIGTVKESGQPLHT